VKQNLVPATPVPAASDLPILPSNTSQVEPNRASDEGEPAGGGGPASPEQLESDKSGPQDASELVLPTSPVSLWMTKLKVSTVDTHPSFVTNTSPTGFAVEKAPHSILAFVRCH
jgi:hypothetical protein